MTIRSSRVQPPVTVAISYYALAVVECECGQNRRLGRYSANNGRRQLMTTMMLMTMMTMAVVRLRLMTMYFT